MKAIHLLPIALLTATLPVRAQAPKAAPRTPMATLTVDAAHPGAPINPAMWGIFFEDINFAADGGLWAEQVKNRSFEFPNPLQGWHEERGKTARGTLTVRQDRPAIAENPHYLRIQSPAPGEGYGVSNEGFRGMGVKADQALAFSLQVRGSGTPALRVRLLAGEHRVLAEGRIADLGPDWAKRELRLTPTASEPGARLELTLEGPGQVDLDALSLMPTDTWKGHGFRADLMGLLTGLKPGFVRFPGGCVVEGRTLANRYQWKRTLGPADTRQPMPNRWLDNMSFEGRTALDYQQSLQLGFYEFFQLCEDLGSEPLPVLSCGMACQFESGEMTALADLDPYVQDALDLIEFANGAADSPWGRVRAAMGHPKPFGLKMLGVGNEQWGPEYLERFERFQKAIKAKYPQIQLAGSAGPWSGGEGFDQAWAGLRGLNAELVDEHYYAPPSWFLANAHRYDKYPRSGPKVFAGEYAAHAERPAKDAPRPNSWEVALAEAAFMTGLERNADVVRLASYAPLLAHTEAWQWSPNLIWFDSLQVAATPSYWVQRLFARNPGSQLLPVRLALTPSATAVAGLYASATLDVATREVVVKVVNASRRPADLDLAFTGLKGKVGAGQLTVLRADLASENPVGAPAKVAPVEQAFAAGVPGRAQVFPPFSLSILRLPITRE